MKIKMVSYYASNQSQVFVTFEYQKIQFDMFKDLHEFESSWKFLQDDGFTKLNKITNIDIVEMNCVNRLRMLDNHISNTHIN